MTAALRAGTARIDITPEWPVMLAGFGQRTTPSTGVHDRLFAKALYVANDADAVLLVTSDLLCIPAPLGRAVIAALAEQTGLAARQICVCASHTHSAPQPAYAGDGAIGVECYAAFVRDALIDVGLEAVRATRAARLRSAVGEVDLFLNRRTRGAPNVVDRRVPVLAFDDAATGAPFAVLFGVGCHPVTFGWDSMLISADFPGRAQHAIEAALPGTNALFFNTTEGNVVPITSPNRDALDPRGYCGTGYAETIRMGDAIAADALRALAGSTPQDEVDVATARADLQIAANGADLDVASARERFDRATATLRRHLGDDFEQRIAPAQLWSFASQCVVAADLAEADMRELMVACCVYLGIGQRMRRGAASRPVDVPVQVLRIGSFELLALPGEVLVEVGDEWRRRTGSEDAFVVGLANAHLRYLPLPSHFAEAEADQRYETITAGLEPSAVGRMLDAAVELRGVVR